MLREAAGCCRGFSGAALCKCTCSGGCNCQCRSESELRDPGTESPGLCTASDTVVFTEVQCGSYRSICGLQSCESDVPCDGPMVETYTSYRRSPQHFPFLDNDATIKGLARELPQYIAATQDVVIKCGGKKVECWKVHEAGVPNWSSAVKKVLLVQPSSAAAKRFYSLLSSSFNEQQDHALSDYFQASVMLLSSIRTVDKIQESVHLNKPCMFI